MVGISNDIVTLLNYLLPGFFAAWLFYALTGHPKSTPFERTVQALIFTVFIRAITSCFQYVALGVYRLTDRSLGSWTQNVDLIWSLGIAFILGHIIAWGANRNWYHQLLYRWRITDRTSWVSEWHSAFSSGDTYIIIHISTDDEHRRHLLGWPFQYPDHPEKGHFVMVDAEWLIPSDDGYERFPLTMDEKVVVPASSVTMVEFVKSPQSQQSELATEGN